MRKSIAKAFKSRGSFAGTAPLLDDCDASPSRGSTAGPVLMGGAQDLVVQKQGDLKKKSSSVLKGWTRRVLRLYKTVLMWSDYGSWKPHQKDMIVLAKIQTVEKDFAAGEFQIVERTGGKNYTTKFKARSLEEADEWIAAITDMKTQEHISRKSEEHGVSPKLCNKVSMAERQRLFKEFALHDQDGSGAIDVNEFRDMCTNLGAGLTEEDAEVAMKELDRDGNGTCDFDEFLWFWSKTPDMGGHSSLGLQFLKARLKAQESLELAQEAATQRIVALDCQLDESDDTSIKLGYALNPSGKPPAEAKMTATLTLSKESKLKAGEVHCIVRLQAEPPSEASRVCAELDALIFRHQADIAAMGFGSPGVSWEEDGGIVVVTLDLASTAVVKGKGSGKGGGPVSQVVTWLKKWEASLSLNFDFNDILASPDKALDPTMLLRHKCTIDAVMTPQMKHLLLGMIPGALAWPQIAWKLLAGCQGDLQLAFDSDQLGSVISQMTGGASDAYLDHAKPAMAQALLKKELDNIPDALKDSLRTLRGIMSNLNTVHSVVVDGLPEAPEDAAVVGVTAWKQIRIDFQRCDPFPLLCYILEPVATGNGASQTATRKPLQTSEMKKLMEVFKQHDKDDNGSIDVNELRDMIRELGGNLSEADAAKAMADLDKDGNGTCDFEEFVGWWSATPGCGGYSSVALELLKMQMSTQAGLGGLKKKFLSFFPGKDQEGLSFNASIEAAPGMAAIESAKMAMSATLRKASPSGWLSSPAPCVEIHMGVHCYGVEPVQAAEAVSKTLQVSLDSLSELMHLAIPNGKWTSQVNKEATPPSVVVAGNLTDIFASVTGDPEFMQIANMVVDGVAHLELHLTFAADFADMLANPSTPVVSLLSGLKVSIKSQLTKEGKQLAEKACPPIEALLRIIVGVDFAILFGYHEKYLEEARLQTDQQQGVKWFTVSDAQKVIDRMSRSSNTLPEDVFRGWNSFRSVTQTLSGIISINFRNIPFGVGGKDVIVELDQFNPFPLISHIFEPLSMLAPTADGTSAAVSDLLSGLTPLDLDEGDSPSVTAMNTTGSKKPTGKAKSKKADPASPEDKKAKAKGKARPKSVVKKAAPERVTSS